MDRETLRKLKQKSHPLFKCILCVFFTSCFSITSISRLVPLHPLHLAGGHSRTNTVSAGGGEPAPKLLLWEGCSHLPPGRPILQVPRHSSFFFFFLCPHLFPVQMSLVISPREAFHPLGSHENSLSREIEFQ